MVLLLYALSPALVDITNYVLVLFKTHFSSTLKNGLDLLSAVNTVASSSPSSLMLSALGMHCPQTFRTDLLVFKSRHCQNLHLSLLSPTFISVPTTGSTDNTRCSVCRRKKYRKSLYQLSQEVKIKSLQHLLFPGGHPSRY